MSEINKTTMPVYPDMCQYLGIGKTRGYQLTKRPDFPVLRIGRRVLVSREKLDEWITKNLGKEITVPTQNSKGRK